MRTGSSSHGAHPRCVLPFAHRWRTDDAAECSCQALAFDHDDSGNCTSQPARPPALQRREAASAIESKCPLYCNCRHSPGPMLLESGNRAKSGQKVIVSDPLEISQLRNKCTTRANGSDRIECPHFLKLTHDRLVHGQGDCFPRRGIDDAAGESKDDGPLAPGHWRRTGRSKRGDGIDGSDALPSPSSCHSMPARRTGPAGTYRLPCGI